MSAAEPMRRVRFASCALLAGAADAALVWLAWHGHVGAAAFAASHALLALGSARVLAGAGGDRSGPLLAALGLALLGPFGALVGLLAALNSGGDPARRRALDRWHRRLSGTLPASPAERLEQEIADGRAFRPGTRPPRLVAVMAQGSVAERQAVLGLLVKGGVAAPPALLAGALRSDEVAVRASAAAAVAKLRERAPAGGALS